MYIIENGEMQKIFKYQKTLNQLLDLKVKFQGIQLLKIWFKGKEIFQILQLKILLF